MMMFGSTNAGSGGGYWYEPNPTELTTISSINEILLQLQRFLIFSDNGTDISGFQITPEEVVLLQNDIKLVLSGNRLQLIEETSPNVDIFSIGVNGDIRTNQVTAGAPTLPANKRLPVYDTNGVLQGYIDLNT